jgi:hypothetical protein
VDYDVEDPGFLSLLQCVALGSTTIFQYTPKIAEMRVHLALKHGKKASAYNKITLTEAQVEEATRELIEIENNKHI